MGNNARNLTMLTDLYELTMMYGYYKQGTHKDRAVFDLFFRKTANGSAYAVAAGLQQAMEYVENLHFSDEDIGYLRSLNLFDETFLGMLRDFTFTGNMLAIPEGTLVFPMEPLIRVEAPIFEAQLMETALLNIINHQTLIATKASRVVEASKGESVLEFGLRRAQGPDAGIYGARAAIIGGCVATSNVLTGQLYGIPIRGTHAHSWVMSFPDEIAAFRSYAESFPAGCILLVDTYDTLKSGVPNAITVFKELIAKGHTPLGIRLDSGDITYLSKQARKMLDDAGMPFVKIFASGDLDEWLIWDLKAQGAKVDVWAVGTKLITGYEQPALGGVYKLAAIERDGAMTPKLKRSDNPAKITNPGKKRVVRLYDGEGMAIADLITLEGEVIDTSKPLTIFDPEQTWKRMTLENFTCRELLVPVFEGGKRVYDDPPIMELQAYHRREMDSFWEQYRRLRNPHVYKVDLSDDLYKLRMDMLGLV